MPVTLITGGTGALGPHLLRLVAGAADADVVVVSREPEGPAARRLIAFLGEDRARRVRLVRGDVTQRELGLAPAQAAVLRARTTRIIHCAAATSFTLPLQRARDVNVAGTRAVLELARSCERVQGIACASTVYVAGKRTGVILETMGTDSDWVNSYEQSKHEMEQVVREAMSTLPVSLYRFSTIIGDSSGVVTGFNAVHHALRLFYQGLAPMVPGLPSTPIDLIPVDFAAAALHELVMRRFQRSETYHLCAGPDGACSLDELLTLTVGAFERVRPAWRKRRIERPAVVNPDTYELFVRSVEESGNVVLQQATRAVQAFAWQLAYPKTFDTGRAGAALDGSGIVAPHVRDFYAKVVAHCVETNWGRGSGAAGGAAA